MSNVSVVFVTAGKPEEASSMGCILVEEKLIACVNIIPGIRSIYYWKGAICNDEECLMIMKTRTALIPVLKERIRELHSYEIPEIIAVPVQQGLPEYLDWVLENTLEQ
ncbi:MAG: divalent-cation tolerance protein CutA [Syntrophobacteraceae bacterium]